ncbi:hypothetical protein ACFQDN_22390 [Pseudomonas asuensis]
MKDIAEKTLSQRQQFLVKNGQALKNAGYNALAMTALAERPVVQQNFVMTHGQTLKNAGYAAYDMTDLAARPAAAREAILQKITSNS